LGKERYEKAELQERVAKNYMQLKDNYWTLLNAVQPREALHEQIVELVTNKIEEASKPSIGGLWS